MRLLRLLCCTLHCSIGFKHEGDFLAIQDAPSTARFV